MAAQDVAGDSSEVIKIKILKVGNESDPEFDLDFTRRSRWFDVGFLCDDGSIVYANKTTLSMWTSVFDVMLNTQDFKEKDATEIILPGKQKEDLVKLMQVLHIPPKPITHDNVYQVLALSDEYQIKQKVTECEKFLMQFPSAYNLVTAEKYGLSELLKICINYAQRKELDEVKAEPGYQDISRESIEEILTHKYKKKKDMVNRMEEEMISFSMDRSCSFDGNSPLVYSHKANCAYRNKLHPGKGHWPYNPDDRCPGCLGKIIKNITSYFHQNIIVVSRGGN